MSRSSPSHALALAILALAILALATAALATAAPSPAATPGHSTSASAAWDVASRLATSAGYCQNVLHTTIAPEASAFASLTADFSLIRFTETQSHLALFLLGEDTRYFDSKAVPKEQWFSGLVQAQQPVGPRDSLGLQVQYLYQNAVVDASETEFALRRLLVVGHSIGLEPNWKHEWFPAWSTRIEGALQRQLYRAELDNHWEGGARLRLLHSYGNRSEWSAAYQSIHRFYDTRRPLDPDFAPLPDAGLVYHQHEIETRWRHFWDPSRHWRTSSRATLLSSRDNGSGYFDFHRAQFSQQLRWNHSLWELTANARFAAYLHPNQRLDNHRRHRSTFSLDVHIERRLGKHAFLHATAQREWNLSNDPLDDYRDWMAAAGVGIEF